MVQMAIVLVIVVFSAAYVLVRAARVLRADRRRGCAGGCSGCASSTTGFVPADVLLTGGGRSAVPPSSAATRG